MSFAIAPEMCAVCGACEVECPVGAISMHESNRYFVIDPTTCTDCGACVEVCPTEAISPADQRAAHATG